MEEKTILISIGGSLIVPDEIDTDFLSKLNLIITKYVQKGYRFVIVAGGGKTARKYQAALRNITDIDNKFVDWIGIHSTILNAQLLKIIFNEHSYDKVVKNPTAEISSDKKVIVAAGWKPGCSTDYDTVLLAENLGIKKVVNLSNIDFVYDKDPKKFDDAKPIKNINWNDFRKLLPKKWEPGLNSPFDPVAAKKAEDLNLEVSTINGNDINNFENYLLDKDFRGTVIKGDKDE